MKYYAGNKKEDGKLATSLSAVSKSIPKADQIGIGSPLKIELLSVQLSNLDLESRGKPRKQPFEPVVISNVTSPLRSQENEGWVRPDLNQLHYDSVLMNKSKFVGKWEIKSKRSSLVHYIPVYEGQTVTVNLNISELDKPMPKASKKAFDQLFDVASAVFLPYSPLIQGAKSLFNVFINLCDAGKEHDTFLEEYCGVEWPLRSISASAGRVVCVQSMKPSSEYLEPIDSTRWKLDGNDQLTDDNGMKLTDRCYAVLEFSNRPLPAGDEGLVNSQKAATLLAELERQKGKDDGHTVVWKQLLSTMNSYSTGQDIQKILELKAKPDPLSDDDKAKLKGYLNIPSIKALEFYDALTKDVDLG